jgi:hypothetical protein
MKLRYERGADLDESFAYIAADSREAAGRLVARIERVAARIAASPPHWRHDTQVRLSTFSAWQIFDRV